MRALVGLAAWLAIRAGARLHTAARRGREASVAAAVPSVAILGQTIQADRAGRLVPVDETLEPHRSLGAHWALWAAVVLIVLILAAGYLRRRWKAGWRPRPAWLAWARGQGRK